MKVAARSFDWRDCPASLQRFAKPGQTFISSERIYEVHAISVFEGQVLFQVVDDLRSPAWVPAWFFSVVEGSIPEDWFCNAFREEPALVVGPSIVARDLESHSRMVELDSDQVSLFWKRVEDRSRASGAEQ